MVPYPEHGGISEGTRCALASERYHKRTNMPPYRPDPIEFELSTIPCVGPHGYGDALAELWRKAKSFINLEHDVAPWPGALTEMWECREPWCAMPLIVHQCVNDTNLGCVKFGAQFMAANPTLWDSYPRNDIYDWRSLDSWLYSKVAPQFHHRHRPAALHVNEAHL